MRYPVIEFGTELFDAVFVGWVVGAAGGYV